MSAAIEQKNQEATIYVGNIDEKITEDIIWELMLQCGPVNSVFMPKDKVTGKHIGYGFVEFKSEDDAEYALKIMTMVKLNQKPLKLNHASHEKKELDVGANLFIGNLDPEVDDKLLYDTFGAFGRIIQAPKVQRDSDTGVSKGFAFISYDNFQSADMAIECMNGQYLCNRPISVQFAFKKDTPGERHGTQAERMLAAAHLQSIALRARPHTMFSGGVGDISNVVPAVNPTTVPMMPANLEQHYQMQMQQYQMQMALYHQQMQQSGYALPQQQMMMQSGVTVVPPPPPPAAIPTMFIPPPPPPPQA